MAPAAVPPRSPDSREFSIRAPCSPARDSGHNLIEHLEQPQPLPLAEAPDSLCVVLDSFPDDRALRLLKPCGCLPELGHRRLVQGESQLYHTATILPYYSLAVASTYLQVASGRAVLR
jgi:hypothetical protein